MRAIHGCCCHHYRWFLNYLIECLPLPSTIYSSCLRGLWKPFIYKTLIICFLFNKDIINHLIALLIVPLDLCNMFDVACKEGYISYDPSHPWSIKVNLFSCGWSHEFYAIHECWYLHSASYITDLDKTSWIDGGDADVFVRRCLEVEILLLGV